MGVERLEERALLAAGSLDTTFNPGGAVPGTLIANLGFVETGQSVAVQSDGKILIAGSIETTGGGPFTRDFGVARFLADGTLDTTFGVSGLATASFASGNHQDTCFDMALDSSGRIILVGQAANFFDDVGIGVARFTSSGVLDTTFDGDGKAFTFVGSLQLVEPHAVAVQSDGKVVVAGVTAVGGGSTRDFITARYTASGSLDTSTFGAGAGYVITDFDTRRDEANDVAIQSDGKIVVAGWTTDTSNVIRFGMVRYDSSGALDTAGFGTAGYVRTDVTGLITPFADADAIESIVVQADGKIVVVGDTDDGSGAADAIVARYTTSGGLDTSFNSAGSQPGIVRVNNSASESANGLAVQANGDYVVAGWKKDGTNEQLLVMRVLAATGQLDSSFGTGGIVHTDLSPGVTSERFTDVVIQADGKIVAGGQFDTTDFVLARYEYTSVTALITGPASVNEGATYTLTTTSTDATTTQWTITWGDGDVQVVPGNPASVAHTYADGANNYTISATVTTSSGTTPLGNTVAVTVDNVDPSLTVAQPTVTVNEGTEATNSGTYGDVPADTVSLVASVGTVLPSAGSWTWSYTPTDDAPPQTVTITATDEDGGMTDITFQLTVNNVAPTLAISGASDVDEGASYTLNLSESDPGTDTITGWTIDWGDGHVVPVAGNPASATHTYDDGDNNYTIIATATDEDGTFTAGNTVAVMVHNVDPALTVDQSSVTVDEGSPAANSGTFGDVPADTVTLSASIGMVVPGAGNWMWSYTPTDNAPPQTVTITATDEDGGLTDVTFQLTVDNVDPTANDATFAVAENSPNGTVVGTVAASDAGTDTLTFSITGGTGAAALVIDSFTGEITVSNGSLLDSDTTPTLTLDVQVDDGDGGYDTALITINVVNLASISGVVYVDVNQNGLFDANEPGIAGVEIELLDQFGNAVLDEFGDAVIAVTGSGGLYLFEDLAPGAYQLHELQPSGVTDGAEQLGSLGGTIVANDRMQLTLAGVDAYDYVFAEIGQQLTSGDAAGIGFWQNKHGQQLITQGGTQLANWLTTNFSNVFGSALVGASGADVATFYRDQLFKQHSKKSTGPAKVDAQFMAVALATYFTSETLAGQTAAAYGFNVTDTGIGTKIRNVGTKGAAFAVANGSNLTIMQLLLATNSLTDQSNSSAGFALIYDTNGDGVINLAEADLRTLANDVYAAINEGGEI